MIRFRERISLRQSLKRASNDFLHFFSFLRQKRFKTGVGRFFQAVELEGFLSLKHGAPGGNRTHDPLLRRQLLYPLSYQGE